jgi:hypothetical protein
VDIFGNLMTSFTADDIAACGGQLKLRTGGKKVEKLVATFAHGAPGEPVALLGSSGFLEIAVNKGNAARVLGVNRGAEVIIELD